MDVLGRLLKPLFLAIALLGAAAAPALAGDKVVYHIDNAAEQGLKALRNIRNHLDVAPDTKIVVVTHAEGVDMLLDGAKDPKSGTLYEPLVAGLKDRGVTFEVCQITMKRRNLDKDKFVMEADFTPSGVVRIAQLQSQEHYAYIKP
ncbi:MAG: DsrE family protein [Hyphomicrobiales bacterium]|nr:DsrE family protein [Hyphomicrobiales bacterium]